MQNKNAIIGGAGGDFGSIPSTGCYSRNLSKVRKNSTMCKYWQSNRLTQELGWNQNWGAKQDDQVTNKSK